MRKLCIFFAAVFLASCNGVKLNEPSDKLATKETRELYYSLQRLQGKGILFGHHDDTGYGVGWSYDKDSSDVKGVTGTYPAIYGWDLAKVEHDSETDINGLPFSVQSKRVREAYERGGINTFSWHMDNPVDSLTAWDTTRRTVADIIPGGKSNDAYKQYLNRAAKYLLSLKGNNGEQIPILFRPFHEMTGDWFWWGKNTCTPDEFKKLWHFTIDYLRNTWNLHNLLIVYSAADFKSESEFSQRYPGDDYVDFVGVDSYCLKDVNAYKQNLDKQMTLLDTIAAHHQKLSCLAETGYLNIPKPDWWTSDLLPVISAHQASYVFIWRNAGPKQYYAPYIGQGSASDFKKFSDDEHLIFQNKLTPLKVYGKDLQ
jgi:mannan endo-1,4-beta-mannosidase